LFELLLPAGVRVLSGELAEIDRLLDDQRFFGPFREFFNATEGRPSIPIETYLRLMFLKYRFDLGYEPLLVEVSKTIDDVELATLSWVHWFNTMKLHGTLGDVPPAEFEAHHYAQLATLSWVHWFNHDRLHGHCGDIPPAEFEAAFYAAQQTHPAGVGNQ